MSATPSLTLDRAAVADTSTPRCSVLILDHPELWCAVVEMLERNNIRVTFGHLEALPDVPPIASFSLVLLPQRKADVHPGLFFDLLTEHSEHTRIVLTVTGLPPLQASRCDSDRYIVPRLLGAEHRPDLILEQLPSGALGAVPLAITA
ncbi:MAG: hypothetical protein ACHQQR_01130 [Gemmatimonadales bacterium]